MPMLSIIVPVYNVENYLEQCLESLTHQSSNSYEIILIDDGSTDSSPIICDRYAESFSVIKVFHLKNSGVSTARNKGLEMATGQYITFVDSDDYVSNAFVETLVQQMKDTDMLMYSHSVFNEKGDVYNKLLESRTIKSKVEIEKYLFKLKTVLLNDWEFFGYIWNKCYRKDIIEENHIRFKKGLACREDNIFNESYFRKIEIMSVLDKPLYNYRVLRKSLTHKKKSQWDYVTISRELEIVTNDISYQPLLLCDKMRILEFYQMSLFPRNFVSYFKEARSFIEKYPFLPMNIWQNISFRGSFRFSLIACYIIFGSHYCFGRFYSFLSKVKHTISSYF